MSKEMLKLVPFNATWVNHPKLDIKAIYRRPRMVSDEYGEQQREYVNGVPTWDLTPPLPVRRHNDWMKKKFEYVTLADRESLVMAARYSTITVANDMGQQEPTMDWKQYDQHQTGGPWNYKKYVQGQDATFTAEEEQLSRDVEDYGSKAVEGLRRRTEPGFTLPNHLQGIQPGGSVAKKKAELLAAAEREAKTAKVS